MTDATLPTFSVAPDVSLRGHLVFELKVNLTDQVASDIYHRLLECTNLSARLSPWQCFTDGGHNLHAVEVQLGSAHAMILSRFFQSLKDIPDLVERYLFVHYEEQFTVGSVVYPDHLDPHTRRQLYESFMATVAMQFADSRINPTELIA